jgi:hypothetical protein
MPVSLTLPVMGREGGVRILAREAQEPKLWTSEWESADTIYRFIIR